MFYRPDVTKPTSDTPKKSADILDQTGSKKRRKFYNILPVRWNLADKIEKKRYLESEEIFKRLGDEEDIESMKQIVKDSREYLQVQFRTREIGDHIVTNRAFWSLPHGPMLVSSWFEWLTGGSEDGWLAATMEKNLESVLVVVSEILLDKKGELWDEKLGEVTANAGAYNGNDTMIWVFLLREWSKLYKEKPHKVIFIASDDSMADMSKQPFVHIRKVQQSGDYEEKVIVSVMCGNTVVFEDLGFTAALALVIEICFAFNLCYDKEADSTLNFIQRIIGGFGEIEGARNEKGKVKSTYVNFQAEFGRIMVLKKLGSVKKLFT